MVQQLVPNLDLEVVCEKLEQTSRTLETGDGRALRTIEVCQDGTQVRLEELLR